MRASERGREAGDFCPAPGQKKNTLRASSTLHMAATMGTDLRVVFRNVERVSFSFFVLWLVVFVFLFVFFLLLCFFVYDTALSSVVLLAALRRPCERGKHVIWQVDRVVRSASAGSVGQGLEC